MVPRASTLGWKHGVLKETTGGSKELVLEAGVDRVGGAGDGPDPLEEVVVVGEGGDAVDAGHHELHQLLLEAARGGGH